MGNRFHYRKVEHGKRGNKNYWYQYYIYNCSSKCVAKYFRLATARRNGYKPLVKGIEG